MRLSVANAVIDWLLEVDNPSVRYITLKDILGKKEYSTNDKRGCFFGTICALEALSEVVVEKMTDDMEQAVKRGVEFFLRHRLFKADHHGYKTIKASWLKLGFPLFVSYSVLRCLNVLTRLRYTEDERINDTVDMILQKRQQDGKWLLEASTFGRMYTNFGSKGKPNKWITLTCLRILKRLNQM